MLIHTYGPRRFSKVTEAKVLMSDEKESKHQYCHNDNRRRQNNDDTYDAGEVMRSIARLDHSRWHYDIYAIEISPN